MKTPGILWKVYLWNQHTGPVQFILVSHLLQLKNKIKKWKIFKMKTWRKAKLKIFIILKQSPSLGFNWKNIMNSSLCLLKKVFLKLMII